MTATDVIVALVILCGVLIILLSIAMSAYDELLDEVRLLRAVTRVGGREVERP